MYSLLYVDDEEELLTIGKIYLEKTGTFRVDVTPSCGSALSLLGERTYDAIISDYQMPEMDGLAFLKVVRASYGDIPFILFTGRGREEVVIEAINDGVDFYLQKGGDIRAQFTELSHKIVRAVERKRMAAQIRANEARVRELVDNLPVMVYECDRQGQITFVNQAGIDILGYPREEFERGLNVGDLIAPSFRNKFIARLLTMRAGKAVPRGQEYILLKKDGRRIPSEAFSSVIFRDGKPDGLRGFFVDLSGQKKTEEELRLLQISVETASDEVFWLDFEGNILNVNEAACRITGYSREELTSMKIFRLDPDFDPARWGASIADLRQKKTQVFETRHRRKDGTVIDVEIMANYVEKDGVEYSFAYARDITGRKRAEMELHAAYEQITAAEEELRQQYDELKKDEDLIRESEARFRTLFESASDAIFIVDMGRFVQCNSRTLAIFGCTDKDQIIGRSPTDFSPEYQADGGSTLAAVRENDRRVMNGETLTFEWLHTKLDGTPFFAEVSLSRVVVDGKNLIQSIVRDISDRKRVEAAATLANRKLFMMNDVSRHVIRNKITGLIGCAEMACEASSPGECRNLSNDMKEMILAIQKQIDFTQEYEKVGVNRPEWQSLKKAAAGVGRPGIEFTAAFSDVEIHADPLLGRIFEYLMENTVRHGGKVTRVSLGTREGPEGLVITFSDNGVGIRKDQKAKIFDQQVGAQRGVGLFLVREILAITGIAIVENGVEGLGARFEMTVPPGEFRPAAGP
ncbi:MAG TPA: PAS domain S-box protein [Methanoregula sp.]|nr:PAS domain S-box protein [Methanoregula sp.]